MKKIILTILVVVFHQNLISQDSLKESLNLMPWPQEISENNSSFTITKALTISFFGEDKKGRVASAANIFLRRLSNITGVFIDRGFSLKAKRASIEITFETISDLSVESDETYELKVLKDKISIYSKTDVGALRALETLLQLVYFNKKEFFFKGVNIKDFPRFVWRGLMVDAARHFQPIAVIKRNLAAMASVKMNVFHWHLSDDQGFRIESKVYPKLTQQSSDGLFYTHEQIKDVVKYASNLGIRVVPEIDIPAHASAILAAYPELGSKKDYDYKIERASGIFDPTLNPTKEITYLFIETLFNEITPLFPDKYFHIGGDENKGKHWDENKEIQEFKKKNKLKTNHDLQTYFNIKVEKILKKLDKKLMGWDEILTPSTPISAVIHSWRGKHEGLQQSTLIEAAKKGYQTVLSAGFYIDRMLSVTEHYLVDPIGNALLTKEEEKRILGAEATMWSELVTPLTIDSRIWPRTAAIAERFWSSKTVNDVDNMRKRLEIINLKLEEVGITHLRNKDVILRNITKNDDIAALRNLTKICEPLKVYSRNAGGTEYKTFSPFTLFADACTADAQDAFFFNKEVKNYLNLDSEKAKNKVVAFLDLWILNDLKFQKIENNKNLLQLKILSENLSKTSTILKFGLIDGKLNTRKKIVLNKLLEKLKQPTLDTELAILTALKSLLKSI